VQALYERLDELADASPGDPRIAALATDLAAHIPDAMADAMIESLDSTAQPSDGGDLPPAFGPTDGADNADGAQWLERLADEMSPAQVAVLRLVVVRLKERA
jgi:hypothetical protein